MTKDRFDSLEDQPVSSYSFTEPTPPSLFSCRWALALALPILFSITFNTPLQFYIKDWVPWLWDPPPRPPSGTVCIRNASSGGVNPICKPRCLSGEFALPGMKDCRPWLTCDDLDDYSFVKGVQIGEGAVKHVHFARWRKFPVAASYLKTPNYRADFEHGIKMLKLLQPSLQVVQFVGSCDDVYLTEYHHLGDGAQLESLFDTHMIISLLNNISTRFRMCLDFVRAIAYVHAHSRVMCDSNDLLKMLSQFLITDDLRLILNDVDALPKVDHESGEKILCGHREIGGDHDYVAPEQRWPFDNLEFDEELQPKYDEKIDVWKIPETCEYLMGDVDGADHAKFHLFDINKEAKKEDPAQRPNVGEVLSIYHAVCEHLEIACY